MQGGRAEAKNFRCLEPEPGLKTCYSGFITGWLAPSTCRADL